MKAGQPEAAEPSSRPAPSKLENRGISIADFSLRIIAAIGTLGSAIAMGTTNERLPFFSQIFTQFVQFRADYDDLPTLTFFVIANSIVCAYLVLSLPLSIFHTIRRAAKTSRIILIIFDTVMLALLAAAASAATAIVYVAHKGNAASNWFAICQQFNNFCERIAASLIGSFVAVVVLMLIIITSAMALSKS